MRFIDEKFLELAFSYRILIALVAVLIIGFLSYKTKQLTISGVIGACIIGFASIYFLALSGILLFLFFFISAAVFSKIKRDGVEKIQKKGSRRDLMQVTANGGPAFLALLLLGFTNNPVYIIPFCASIAEACSDTWASEIGKISKVSPFSIITFKKVPHGVSGGITMLGTISAFMASLCYGIFYLGLFDERGIWAASIIIITSFFGCILDSILGGSIQAHYLDEEENVLTEKSEKDGKKLKLVRGFRIVDNDMVNLLSNFSVFILSLGLAQIL